MHGNLLRKLNIALYLLLALAASVLQSTVFQYSPMQYLHPDFVFILAVYCGTRRGDIEGGILVLLAAAVYESLSGAAHYFLVTSYLYVFVMAKLMGRFFVVKRPLALVGASVALYTLKQATLFALFALQGRQTNAAWHLLAHLVPGAAVQAALLLPLFTLFQKIDLRTSALESPEEGLGSGGEA